MSKSFEMDQNSYEKCVIYIQVHSDEDEKFYHILLYMYLRRKWMSKSYEMDQSLCKKCIIYIQVHSGEDVKYLDLYLK